MLICQKVFQNSTLAQEYDQKRSTENQERSSFEEEEFIDAGGLQILSRVGIYFHLFPVPHPH